MLLTYPPKVARQLLRPGTLETSSQCQRIVMGDKLTIDEFFALFGRTSEQTRWAGSADSEEYLTLLTFLVERAGRGSQGII